MRAARCASARSTASWAPTSSGLASVLAARRTGGGGSTPSARAAITLALAPSLSACVGAISPLLTAAA